MYVLDVARVILDIQHNIADPLLQGSMTNLVSYDLLRLPLIVTPAGHRP
jgi:hypothetical protein